MITADAELVVRAPKYLSDRDIARFIAQKRVWIERNIARQASRPKPVVLTDEERARWRQVARERITERCRYFSELTGYRPAKVRITAARSRWGSCGAKGNINFTWRLALAPPAVIDYVIVHELAHLAELNHSARFWQRVSQVVPDHRVHRRWLRDNGHLLAV
ncbi:MAG: M48 family metallopeptidase [Candidatus Margulisiibacteriota bacterium]